MSTDIEPTIRHTYANASDQPITVARYVVDVVMNEKQPNRTDAEHIDAFAAEFQHALHKGFFTELRYDYMTFTVSRALLATIPPDNVHMVGVKTIHVEATEEHDSGWVAHAVLSDDTFSWPMGARVYDTSGGADRECLMIRWRNHGPVIERQLED
jgi:hypothetical protein